MTVSPIERIMAIHISQSSHPNWWPANLPAALIVTTTSARAGNKNMMVMAKIWSWVGAGSG